MRQRYRGRDRREGEGYRERDGFERMAIEGQGSASLEDTRVFPISTDR